METKYWLVGAAFGGVDHQDEHFLEQGIWMLGWQEGQQHERAKEIAPGDRLAIKRRLSRGR